MFTFKLFVSETLFSTQLGPRPSFRQINIAPEIAGISGIFEVLVEKRRRPEQVAPCDTLEVGGGARPRWDHQ